ncbi:hypothetical protein L3X38_032427 [Prunus dulcis]|uniref:Uncharacterized protein n=1 Tax=Prunus dulcis TaxID=3755 RepID=A0AAD4VE33_PRUDU|nr:hypothetical protein L3X38_032427 [Prunus dulcis]
MISKKLIFVSALLTPQELQEYTQLLQEYQDVFAWSYQDMPGSDRNVVVHKLGILDEARWVKQAPRRFRLELTIQIEIEIDKLIAAGFIREVQYPTWLSNIVPVLKRIGHCVYVWTIERCQPFSRVMKKDVPFV